MTGENRGAEGANQRGGCPIKAPGFSSSSRAAVIYAFCVTALNGRNSASLHKSRRGAGRWSRAGRLDTGPVNPARRRGNNRPALLALTGRAWTSS
ncbi:hypothetical protein MHYP_G00032710 [Metynnis hypsauchen]